MGLSSGPSVAKRLFKRGLIYYNDNDDDVGDDDDKSYESDKDTNLNIAKIKFILFIPIFS